MLYEDIVLCSRIAAICIVTIVFLYRKGMFTRKA